MKLNKLFYKYFVYYPIVIIRGEWVYPYLKLFRRSQFWSVDKIEQNQLIKLKWLFQVARNKVPYYSEILPENIKTLDELQNVPILTKEQVRNDFESLQSRSLTFLKGVKTTGGSTGAPVTINKDNKSMAQELAATWRGYQWAGIDIGDKQARFWGVPANKSSYLRSKLVDTVTNRTRLSAFSFQEKDFDNYICQLNSFKPKYFYGYVSMLRQFSDYILKKNIILDFNVAAVVTTSEVLTELDRKAIEKAFETRVYNEYGCGEIGTIAHECEYGSMHINSENMIVEILDDNGAKVKDGVVGEIVVTELNNHLMPLIRYQMKDFASISKEKCSCGRNLPILKDIQGRAYDILYNTQGDAFHGEFFLYMLEDLKKENVIINGFQVEQTHENNLSIRLVAQDSDYKLAVNYLSKRIKETFSSDVQLEFYSVGTIEREKSGKLRVVKRAVN